MRRSASEVIRNLEGRISRLENSTSRRTKSAAQTAKLSNDRAIIMVDDRQFKDDTIKLCLMHMNRTILKKSLNDLEKRLDGPTPNYLEIVEDYFVSSECDSCICITVQLMDQSFWGHDGEDLSHIARAWIDENIINLPNSIPAK